MSYFVAFNGIEHMLFQQKKESGRVKPQKHIIPRNEPNGIFDLGQVSQRFELDETIDKVQSQKEIGILPFSTL